MQGRSIPCRLPFRTVAVVYGVVSPRDSRRVRGTDRSGMRKLGGAGRSRCGACARMGTSGCPRSASFAGPAENLRALTESAPPVAALPRPVPHRPQTRRCHAKSAFSASDAKSICDDITCNAAPSQGLPRRDSRPQDTASFAWRPPLPWTGDGFRPVCGEGREPTRLKPPRGRGERVAPGWFRASGRTFGKGATAGCGPAAARATSRAGAGVVRENMSGR